MKKQNVIEINGRLYDAASGEPLQVVSASAPLAAKATAKKMPAAVVTKPTKPQQKFVDGVHRSTKATAAPTKRPTQTRAISVNKTTAAAAAKPKAAAHSNVTRSSAPQARTHPKHSVTLHRQGVSAPTIKQGTRTVAEPQNKVVPKLDSARTERAARISKSPIISRFNRMTSGRDIIKPSTQSASIKQPTLTGHLTQTHGTASHEKAKQQLVKKAIAGASLQQPTYRRGKGTRFMGYGSAALVAIVLAGYVAYLNVPSISLKVAASRAGFAANMPRTPSGYGLSGPIAYSPGQVTINFKANTDERRFSIHQQPTNWDSVALLENYVTKQDQSYSTYQDRGLTIYLYGAGSAAWVNGGKFYNIDGSKSQLDTAQLLDIATSM